MDDGFHCVFACNVAQLSVKVSVTTGASTQVEPESVVPVAQV